MSAGSGEGLVQLPGQNPSYQPRWIHSRRQPADQRRSQSCLLVRPPQSARARRSGRRARSTSRSTDRTPTTRSTSLRAVATTAGQTSRLSRRQDLRLRELVGLQTNALRDAAPRECGARLGPHTDRNGVEQRPLHSAPSHVLHSRHRLQRRRASAARRWRPAESTSTLRDAIPGWRNSLLALSLIRGVVYRLTLSPDGRSVTGAPVGAVSHCEPVSRHRPEPRRPDDSTSRPIQKVPAATHRARHARLANPGSILEFKYAGN